MCGIVGYWGPKNPKDVILEGLRRLEYRGYDSAGVAILDNHRFRQLRAEGKLVHLEQKLEKENFNGRLGVGHTRWATHGVPSEKNAHPHVVDGVSLVHNGIIENYMEIREDLLKQGAQILSDTDSELVAHLISRELNSNKGFDGHKSKLLRAVFTIMPRLRGAFSIVVACEREPDVLVAFKNGPPLILGIGNNECVVASDVQAIVGHTRQVVYLDDNEILFTEGAKYQFYSGRGELLHKQIFSVDWTQEVSERKGYAHFMLKEIFEQPRAAASAMTPHLDLTSLGIEFSDLNFSLGSSASGIPEGLRSYRNVFRETRRIYIVSCGTSYYAGMVGEYLFEKLSRVPVEVELASEFRYRNPILDSGSLFITISQSGETADTLAALRLAKSMGARTLSLCNVKNSSIDREAQAHLYMRSEPEIGVASTKAFTSTLVLLNLMAISMGKIQGHLSEAEEREHVENLLKVPAQLEKVLIHDKFFREAAQALKSYKGFLYIGRGVSYPLALEGALKLKELAYMHAEGYAAGEMKHGPIALIDSEMAVVVVCPEDDVFEKSVSNLEAVRARGAKVISLGSGENSKLKQLSLHYLPLPEASWNINPILAAIPLQLLSYHVAVAKGHDVDQPRNLAKSVTVE